MYKHFISLATALICCFWAYSQPSQRIIAIRVTPQCESAVHSVSDVANAYHFDYGTDIRFNISATSSGIPIELDSVAYSICYDKMEPHKQGVVRLKDGVATIEGGTMLESGFLRCTASTVVDGERFSGSCAVGFNPEAIVPTVPIPGDFVQWWQSRLDTLALVKNIAELTLLPELCTEKINVYQARISSVRPMYGILAVPKAPGRYPAVMRVPGAGVHKIGGYLDLAEEGMITLDLGIHGLPLTQSDSYYRHISTDSLNNYPAMGIDNRLTYYYHDVYLGCVRAAEYLASMEQFDGKNLFVTGGSQGGALSIVTAALCPKVSAVISFFPAMCDQEAYLHGRAGGWPHYFLFNRSKSDVQRHAEVIQYYDVVNFARILRTPVFMSMGYNDLTCAPTSTYAAWNVIASQHKKLLIVPETGHWRYNFQTASAWTWIMQFRK
ncbi:MAG: acetylxylan esterase [Muribaculaceae bacterium]